MCKEIYWDLRKLCRNFVSRASSVSVRKNFLSVGIHKFETQRETYEWRVNHFAIPVILKEERPWHRRKEERMGGLNSWETNESDADARRVSAAAAEVFWDQIKPRKSWLCEATAVESLLESRWSRTLQAPPGCEIVAANPGFLAKSKRIVS